MPTSSGPWLWILRRDKFSLSPKSRLISPHGQFCLWFFISASLSCGRYSPSWVSALQLDPPECMHSKTCHWSPCMTINPNIQPSSSSSGLHGLKAFLLFWFYAPASQDFSYLFADSYMTLKGCLRNILCSI